MVCFDLRPRSGSVDEIGGDEVDRRKGTKAPKIEGIFTRAARRDGRIQPIKDQKDRK